MHVYPFKIHCSPALCLRLVTAILVDLATGLFALFRTKAKSSATYNTQTIIIACPTTRVLALLQLTTDTTATNDTTIP